VNRVLAAPTVSATAWIALTAGLDPVDDDVVPDGNGVDSVTDVDHLAGQFVAEYDWIRNP
jgi:hypothetical protein